MALRQADYPTTRLTSFRTPRGSLHAGPRRRSPATSSARSATTSRHGRAAPASRGARPHSTVSPRLRAPGGSRLYVAAFAPDVPSCSAGCDLTDSQRVSERPLADGLGDVLASEALQS